jgi:hypothetical protein
VLAFMSPVMGRTLGGYRRTGRRRRAHPTRRSPARATRPPRAQRGGMWFRQWKTVMRYWPPGTVSNTYPSSARAGKAPRGPWCPEIVGAIAPVIDAFERLSVGYSVVGSVASSAHGIARATLDADLVADLGAEHVDPLVDALIDDYYIDRDAAAEAIRRRAMFNVVHLETMLKVDIYLLTGRPFDRESFRRRIFAALEDADDARQYAIDTPEDTVLHKLEWCRA